MNISSELLVCYPCRQNVTRTVAESGYTPRWKKGRKTPRDQCFMLDCTDFSIAHMSVSSDKLSDMQSIQFKSETIPCIVNCKSHYYVLYDTVSLKTFATRNFREFRGF